ncbi:MAG: putative toxin-antitoxin system toxin component, PIN family [Leptolyngbyaceae cyanobacterium SL_5_14]|nr:putative toxin-antitoxin system toxin component, PIN family [Leptolyngbyaceae cyanobacterium SL_5_14]
MKVVIDTNILVSAVLRDRDPELVIQFIVDHPELEWITSQNILDEYKEVLSRRKFRLTQEIKDRWFDLLDAALTLIEVDTSVDFLVDPDDAMFLACTITGDADFLITGDSDLFQAESLLNVAVVTVSTFKSLFCEVS